METITFQYALLKSREGRGTNLVKGFQNYDDFELFFKNIVNAISNSIQKTSYFIEVDFDSKQIFIRGEMNKLISRYHFAKHIDEDLLVHEEPEFELETQYIGTLPGVLKGKYYDLMKVKNHIKQLDKDHTEDTSLRLSDGSVYSLKLKNYI